MAKQLEEIRPMLRDLPERVPVLGAWYDVVTDDDFVDDHLDDDALGEVWHYQYKILIRKRNISLRAQWQTLVHEIIEIIKKQLSISIEHDDIDRLDSGIAGTLEGIGLLRRDND
jgi:hypothetical protein